MAGESVIFDPTSENAANAQLDVNDQVSYFLLEHDYPLPDIDALYASSADTEGDIPVSSRDKNRVVTGKIRVVGSSALDLDQRIDAIAQKVGKFKREGGTLKRTSPSGVVAIFDVLPESMLNVVYDKHYLARQKTLLDYKLVCAPYIRGAEVGTILDDFSSDSIGAGSWTYSDSGAGALTVTGGVLTPTSTARKSLARTSWGLFYDCQVTLKVHVGPLAGSYVATPALKWAPPVNNTGAGNNYIWATNEGGVLRIYKRVAGTNTPLGPPGPAVTVLANTDYWIRVRIEGNLVTAEWWTSAPTTTGTPAATQQVTLAGADAAQFGAGVAGYVGLGWWVPPDTSNTIDDFQVDPYVYVEKNNPVLVTPPIYGIKGDVPALGRLVLSELASLDQWWAIYGNESRYFKQGVPTILDQFGVDTIGSGAWTVDSGGGTISVSGGQLVPSTTAEKRMHRTDSTAYTDTRQVVKVVPGASVASGSMALIARWQADTDFLFARLNFAGVTSNLTLHKRTAGTDSGALATGSNFATSAGFAEWLEFVVQGTKLTVNIYASDPSSGAPITAGATATYTLTAAEAAQFASGACGLRLVPVGTDYRWDEYRALPLQGCTEVLIDSEALLTSGYSGVQTTRAGAFSGGTVANHVVRHTLAQAYAASCGFAPQGHVGWYRVFARLYRPTNNTGQVSAALEWGTGDFVRVTHNDDVVFGVDEREGDFTITDLGSIQIPPATKGAQQWQGRIVAKSTVLSDVLDIDYVFLVPYLEGSAEVSAVVQTTTPSVLTAHDEFNQGAGNLAGVALPAGGSWASSGAATDFVVETAGHTAQRATTADAAGFGHQALAGATTFTNCQLSLDFKMSAAANPSRCALLFHYVDASNFGTAEVVLDASHGYALRITKVIAGTAFDVRWVPLGSSPLLSTWYTLRALVFASGAVLLGHGLQGAQPTTWISGSDAVFATGGALASGLAGFQDINTSATASTRNYDNFWVSPLTPDAAVFAGRQAEIRYDSAVRQDSGGTLWTPESRFEGDFAHLIPAGREGRQNRLVVDTSRALPATMTDPSLSKTQLQVIHTPRYLSIPAG